MRYQANYISKNGCPTYVYSNDFKDCLNCFDKAKNKRLLITTISK